MIKLNYYIRRRPALSADEFRQHWNEKHGPLWGQFADALGVRRYVHLHDWPAAFFLVLREFDARLARLAQHALRAIQ